MRYIFNLKKRTNNHNFFHSSDLNRATNSIIIHMFLWSKKEVQLKIVDHGITRKKEYEGSPRSTRPDV